MKRHAIWIILALSACSAAPVRDTSTLDRVNDELKQASSPKPAVAVQAPSESVYNMLLPPLKVTVPKAKGKQLEQRFDLVVTDAPLNQVLMAIVTDTHYSMLMQPKSTMARTVTGAPIVLPIPEATEKITVNLKNVTVLEALEALREMYGVEYKVDGTRIYVRSAEMQIKVYQVNYIPGIRRGVSDLQVIGGASAGSSSSGGGGQQAGQQPGQQAGGGSSYASVQASALTTFAKADIWGEVEDTLRTVLGCQISKVTAAATTTTTKASRSDVSSPGDTQSGERLRGVDGCPDGRAMTINQMSGTIVVRGMPEELRAIEGILRLMQLNIERQVIIEAKIIDVTLNKGSQQGINWAGFQSGLHRVSVGANTANILNTTASTSGGALLNPTTTSLGNLLGTGLIGAAGSAFGAGVGIAVQARNFSALIGFLQTQGDVHVLSSPRISTLNNQKAILKVGSEEPYVTSISGGSTSGGGG